MYQPDQPKAHASPENSHLRPQVDPPTLRDAFVLYAVGDGLRRNCPERKIALQTVKKPEFFGREGK